MKTATMKTATWFALLPVALMISCLCWAAQGSRAPDLRLDFTWKQSLPLRSGDPAITAIGGTELRSLATFDQKLFAAVGYWMDTEKNSPGLPGAQVLRLDSAHSQWQVDLELTDRLPGGLRKYQAISVLAKVHFSTDGEANALADPVDLLLAGVWKRDIGLDVFWRRTGSGFFPWSKTAIAGQEAAPRGTQLRSFIVHKDRVTGAESVFAGATSAIFVGHYDAGGRIIVWQPQPEWHEDAGTRPSAAARVASLAECNGKLYATAHDTIYERSDGSVPGWKKVFETKIHLPNPRVTGLRGLTCIRDRAGADNVLLVAVEDEPSRIYRIDPRRANAAGEYDAVLELDVSSFLTDALGGSEATYAIVAYNNMTEYPDSAGGCPYLLIGLETITPQAAEWFGGQHFNPHGHYLLRNCSGDYALREIRDDELVPEPQLVAVRTFALSPFQSDEPGVVYAGGFDANYTPVHNTAWLYKGVPKAQE
jgi:hypothetical protein